VRGKGAGKERPRWQEGVISLGIHNLEEKPPACETRVGGGPKGDEGKESGASHGRIKEKKQGGGGKIEGEGATKTRDITPYQTEKRRGPERRSAWINKNESK